MQKELVVATTANGRLSISEGGKRWTEQLHLEPCKKYLLLERTTSFKEFFAVFYSAIINAETAKNFIYESKNWLRKFL